MSDLEHLIKSHRMTAMDTCACGHKYVLATHTMKTRHLATMIEQAGWTKQ